MEIWREIKNRTWSRPSVIMIGKFDGMHKGHKAILDTVISEAECNGLSSIVFSFDFHKENALMSGSDKTEYFRHFKIDLYIDCPFDDYIRTMSREDFLKKTLLRDLNVKKIVVGEDFSFGYKGEGTPKYLKENESLGYETIIVDTVKISGEKISSTRIRRALDEGDNENADIMLGYRYR